MSIKQVIIVRKDLEMRKGKLASQVVHASMAFLTRRLDPYCTDEIGRVVCAISDVEQKWIDGIFTKVVVWVKDEPEFHAVVQAARDAGLEVNPIQDNGLTDFHGVKTWTTAGIGPDTSERLDPITGHLKLVG